ncbi:MAG: ABC transporter permease [Bacteroidota bacterium]
MKRLLLIILLVVIFIPFLTLLVFSVGGEWSYPAILPGNISLKHWTSLFSGASGTGKALTISLVVSLAVATLATGLSFFTSRYLAYHRFRERLLVLAYFPYVFSPVILAACLQFYFIRSGLSGNVLGIVIAQLFITFPFGVIFFMGFWNEEMKRMADAVSTLGGTPLQGFLKVLLPMAKGALLVCFFQTFLISWFEYGLTTLIGVGKVQTLTLTVFQYVNEANIFLAALAGLLLVVPPALLLWFNRRFIVLAD